MFLRRMLYLALYRWLDTSDFQLEIGMTADPQPPHPQLPSQDDYLGTDTLLRKFLRVFGLSHPDLFLLLILDDRHPEEVAQLSVIFDIKL